MGLKWSLPINSTNGMISVLKNTVFILDYVQENKCDTKCIDSLIENDVRPFISGLKDEYDFMFACITIAICETTKDYSDQKTLIDLAVQVMGQFLTALEMCANELYDDDCPDGLIREIDTSKLIIGMVIKNYKELCNLLGVETKTGKSKQLQLKEFKRFFDWEKAGQNFIITDIYDTPLPKEDLRKKGNNSIYKNYIELILLQYLLKQEGYKKTFTKRNWLELLGMINKKYGKEPREKLKKLDYRINNHEINLFYVRSNRKLEQILFTALKSLEREKLIIVEFETVVVFIDDYGKEHRFIANDRQKKNILTVERNVLTNVMVYKSMFQVCMNNKLKEYFNAVDEELNKLYGWNYYYKQIKIIYDQPNIVEAIPSKELSLQKEILNNKIVEFLNDNAKKVYEKKESEYDEALEEYLSDWIGDKEYLKDRVKVPNTWKYPNAYIEAQKILTDELICIGHENIEFLPDKLLSVAEENNEFLAWMA